MSDLGVPITEIKDTQRPENIPWEDCVLLLQVGRAFVEVGVLQQDTGYFLRLLRYGYEADGSGSALMKRVKSVLDVQGIQAGRCKKTILMIDTPHYVPVPEKVGGTMALTDLNQFLFAGNAEEVLRTDSGISGQWYLQYAINKTLLEEAQAYFKNLEVLHQQTALLKKRKEAETEKLQMYLTYSPGQLAMAAFVKRQLQILQSFKAETVADILYGILNFIEIRHLPKTARVFMTGDFPEGDAVRARLRAELGEAEWLALPEGGQYPSAMDNYSGHCFYHLVSLGLCE